MIILGIDPGTATTGFGVIEGEPNIKHISHGCIETSSKLPAAQRLEEINQKLNKIIKQYRPDILAVETLFFFKNLKTAMPVSQAKGVILFTAAKQKIPIREFTPLQAKMAVTGYGRATKKQVQEMVKLLLSLEEIPRPDDSADALAIAICCSRLTRVF